MFIQLADASKYFLKYFITVNFVRIFGFTRTVLPGPNHQKTPQTLQKQYIYIIIYKYIIYYILYIHHISFEDDWGRLRPSKRLIFFPENPNRPAPKSGRNDLNNPKHLKK